MFRWLGSRILWGGLLILGGVMFLLQNLGLLPFGDIFWGLLFLLAGAFFLSVFFQNRANWWAIIPGFTMLGIGTAFILEVITAGRWSVFSGVIILGSIGLSFLVLYFFEREQWWALIPAGTLFTLAIVAGLDQVLEGYDMGGVFFLGLGLTFAVVALAPVTQPSLRWAWIPAGILLVMGLILLATSVNLINYVWPVLLIVGGGYLVLCTVLRKG